MINNNDDNREVIELLMKEFQAFLLKEDFLNYGEIVFTITKQGGKYTRMKKKIEESVKIPD